MKSILKAIYANEFEIGADKFPEGAEYRNRIHSISEIKTYLTSSLSQKDNELLEEMLMHQDILDSFYNSENFKSGFFTGVLMMIEVMTSREAEICRD